jgi:hypothetical protein
MVKGIFGHKKKTSRLSEALTWAAATTTVSREYCPVRRSDINFRIIEGEMVVVDRKTGLVHQLNTTSSRIWSLCDGKSTIQDIVDDIVRIYEIDSATAVRDVTKLIGDFRNRGLLVERKRKKDSLAWKSNRWRRSCPAETQLSKRPS